MEFPLQLKGFQPPGRMKPGTVRTAGQCLTHCILVDSSTVGQVHYVILGCQAYFVAFILFMMEIQLANDVDPDLSLHCLLMTLLRVSRV